MVFSNLHVMKDLHKAANAHSQKNSARQNACANSKVFMMSHTDTTAIDRSLSQHDNTQ